MPLSMKLSGILCLCSLGQCVLPALPLYVPTIIAATSASLELDTSLYSPSGLSAESIDMKLVGTGLAGLGSAFVAAENEYGVNAAFLVSMACLESHWGQSGIFAAKNNAFGFMAYDDSTTSAAYFDSVADGVMFVSHYIAQEYLDPRGIWYEGERLRDVGIHYSSDPLWAGKIVAISHQLWEG